MLFNYGNVEIFNSQDEQGARQKTTQKTYILNFFKKWSFKESFSAEAD